jgi:hypothetical protein
VLRPVAAALALLTHLEVLPVVGELGYYAILGGSPWTGVLDVAAWTLITDANAVAVSFLVARLRFLMVCVDAGVISAMPHIRTAEVSFR